MEGKRNTRDGCTKNIRIIQFDRDDISDTVNYTIQIIDTIGFQDPLQTYTDGRIRYEILTTIIGGNEEEEEKDTSNFSSLPLQQAKSIDAILIFDTAKDQRNNLVHSQR